MDVQGRVTSAAPLRPGDPTTVGRYEIRGRIGEGGMGMVYLGRAPDGRDVAVKVVRAELAGDAVFLARFRDEVGNAERVASFCTAQVLDHGEADGRAYMVTEFIDGPSLAEYVERDGALTPGMLHGVAVGVATALVAIHSAGLVHRDLKPRNVLLSISGPRVIDFGIARALDEAAAVHTRTGQVIGSPGWMAPELMLGRDVTPAADIFAWGCLIAYAGTGRNPYGKGAFQLMAARVMHAEPDLGSLTAPLLDLVRAALDKRPGNRPTAQDLLLSLIGGTSRAAVQETLVKSWAPAAVPATAPAAAAAPTTPSLPSRDRKPRRIGLLPAAGAIALVAAAAVAGGLVLESALDDSPGTQSPTGGGPSAQAPAASATANAAGLPVEPLVVREDRSAGWPKQCHGSVAVVTPGASSAPKRLLPDDQCDTLPRWSPDRKRISFTRAKGDRSELYVMNADGSGLQKVTEVAGSTRTSWSPDGRRLAYADSTGGNRELFIITIGSANPQRVTYSAAAKGGPDWSRDGRHIAFWSDRDGVQQIYTLDLNDIEKPWTKVTSAPTGADDPMWSPDGRWIAYTWVNQNRKNDIGVIGADGRGNRRLTDDPAHEMDPNWSPDGRWIAFARGAVETPRLWAIRADGTGDAQRVTTTSRSVGHPGWT